VLVSLLIGMVLGQRFKVLVLVPGIGLALVVTIVAGIARTDSAWQIVVTSAAVVASLQNRLSRGHRHPSPDRSRARNPSARRVACASMPARHPAR
jgi:hypothetical protein